MRRIKKAKITFITLCARGKNQMPVLYKADGTVEFATVSKASEDAGELTNIVYPPEKPDADGHLASAEVIKQMAHDFQRDGGQIDIKHDGKAVTKDQAYVAESFIVQKGDPRFDGFKDYDGNPVDTEGAWATVIKIDDPTLRQLYRDGEWNGVSMFGQGLLTVEKSADEDPPGWFNKFLKACRLGSTTDTPPEINMEEKELLKALEGFSDKIIKAITPEVKEDPKDETIKKSEETTKVDLDDLKAVREHLAGLEKAEALKNVDLTDLKSVQAHFEKLQAASKSALEKEESGDSDEVKDLKAQLRKAEGKSNQPLDNTNTGGEYANLTKSEIEAVKAGDIMADYLNREEK